MEQARFSMAEAGKIIRHIIASGGTIEIAKHCRERMRERGFNRQDVIHVLRKGAILMEPEPHIKTGRWVYCVEGETLDGKRIRVHVDIRREDNLIVLVTVMKRGR